MEEIGARDVRARATAGAALLGARGLAVMVVGVVANLALARLLTPRDFGLVALGTVLVTLGGYLAEGGLGAALIRREEPPTRTELEAVLGVQLTALLAVAALVAATGAAFGRDGLVVATMTAALPIATLRTPSVIVLERELRYRPIAVADVTEALVYYAWALAAVALGAGVWGLATAVVVRAVAGSATVVALGPVGSLRPRWSWSAIRPFVGFGAKFQAVGALQVAREQGLNVLVAAVAGVPALGVWNLAWRVLQLPALFFLTISRVAFPAMSRLLAGGEDARPLLERSVEALGAITGAAIVGLVGFAPALPELVGSGWGDVPAVILWSGVALTIGAPVTTATLGYLYAAGAAGVAVVSTLASGAVWFAGTAALLPALGPPGIAVAWIGMAAVQAAILGWRANALSGAALAGRAAVPAAISLVALAAGWLVAHVPHERLLGGIAGFVAAELVLLAGLALLSRSGLRDAAVLVRQGVGSLALRRGSRP